MSVETGSCPLGWLMFNNDPRMAPRGQHARMSACLGDECEWRVNGMCAVVALATGSGAALTADGHDGNTEVALCIGADGVPLSIGDHVTWSNEGDEDESFVLRGVMVEGGVDGDVFLLDGDHNSWWLGNCRKKKP